MEYIDEREYLDALVGLGLNLREARIYLSLLTRHDFSVTEIAKSARLSRPAAYELLNKMVTLGICKEKPGKVKRFMAISPTIALSHLIEHESEELKTILESRQNRIGDLACNRRAMMIHSMLPAMSTELANLMESISFIM